MRSARFDSAWVIVLLGMSLCARANEPPAATQRETAAKQYTHAAMQAEVSGRNDERKQLLSHALELKPDFSAARWQAGYVSINGRWESVEQAEKAAANDVLRIEYEKFRQRWRDDVTGNLSLGKWCADHNLPDGARAHYLRVITFDPDNKQARGALDHRRVRGVWLTDAEFALYQQREQQQRKANDRYRPIAMSLRRRLNDLQKSVRESAEVELLAIRDPQAVYPLVSQLAGTSQRADKLLVQVLERITTPGSTLVLARMSILSNSREARIASARCLKERELEVFAPPLLAAMYKPVAHHNVTLEDDTRLAVQHTVTTERQFAVNTVANDHVRYLVPATFIAKRPTLRRDVAQLRTFTAIDKYNGRRTNEWLEESSPLLAHEAELQAYFLREMDKEIRLNAEETNGRIAAALNTATHQDLPPDPATWWTWWEDECRLKSSSKPEHIVYASSESVLRTGTLKQIVPRWVSSRANSCFAAGTPVRTSVGWRPIEQIQIGDMVLSQDADTGELAYKPVLDISNGPPTLLMKLGAGDETIQCTPNHQFWVNGTGWVPAQEMADGSYLHGVGGAAPLWSVEKGQTEPTHNLVVADFNTYFVGREGLLVHDNSVWKRAESLVPGMASR